MVDVVEVEESGERAGDAGGGGFFGHPVGLANLFGVELWERFSFYGMVGILAYYLYYSVSRGGLGMPEGASVGMVGAYGGLVYLCTVVGGWVSDRVLGMERTVLVGGCVIVAGHGALALVPGIGGVGVGLVLVAVGSGCLKANASSLLGTLYREGDPRVAGGFTVFYLGVNLGAFAGPLLTGLLQVNWGFHAGFGAAAVGMSVGLAQYVIFRRNLGNAGKDIANHLPRKSVGRVVGFVVLGIVIIAVALFSGLLNVGNLSDVTVVGIAVVSVFSFAVILRDRQLTDVDRGRVWAFASLYLANAVFWMLFQQLFTVLAVYSDRRVDWRIFGWRAPASWLGSAEPVWVILLSPVFAVLWTKWGTRAPSTPSKFAYGVLGIGIAFWMLAPLALIPGRGVPAVLVILILLVFAISELLLSPTGLAVTTQLAPEKYRSHMMALNFLSVGLGTALSGWAARYYAPEHEMAYFGVTGTIAVLAGVSTMALTPYIRRQMAGVH